MTLVDQLRAIVGPEHVITEASVTATYETDWTGRFRGTAHCVVRPADTAEVAAVVGACATDGVAISLQGGNTGLVGGSVPADGSVLLSLARLTSLEPVDIVSGQVTVGAGVTLSLDELISVLGESFELLGPAMSAAAGRVPVAV